MQGPTGGDAVVRAARVEDAEALGRVHVRAWRAAYRDVMPHAFLDGLDPSRRAEGWRRRLRAPGPDGVVVAESAAGDVVGFACAGPAREGAGGDGELYALNTVPEAWGTGAGASLLAAAHAHLHGRGHRTATLWVVRDNPRARRFYERHGWRADGVTQVGTVGRTGSGEAVEVDEVRYVRRLG